MTSTIPAAIDALVALATLVIPNDGSLQVVDGSPGPTVLANTVHIAYGGDSGATSVTMVDSVADLGRGEDAESYDIACVATVLAGPDTMKAARDRLFTYRDALRAELAADKTLGGVVTSARFTSGDLTLQQTNQGALAQLQFTVHVDAFEGA